ncbi:related to sec7-domain protein [Rhynchosporium graminicola]|uniref:Related to sec7-domain protein n=1 Tax=Rhynchosporium graminicola TaxID=2792576 RepID=A0A1E1L8T1_9HELO|nr:related to sec7-domain protein [Rhynchosporium commune]
MPLMTGLLRRRGPSSNAELRRHSVYSAESSTDLPVPVVDGRVSEQITRRLSAADLLSPYAASKGQSLSGTAAESGTESMHRTVSPPIQEESQKHRRFSMLKFRHASDSQLATRARLQARADADTPPLPQPPAIITTAPTMDINSSKAAKKKSRVKLPGRAKTATADSQNEAPISTTLAKHEKKERRKTMSETTPSGTRSRVTFDEPERPVTHVGGSPPAYGEDSSSTLALPINRLSESSRSDGSSGDHGVYATTTTTTHTVHTTTTFFRLPRRKKPAPLFDLSHLPQKNNNHESSQSLVAPSRTSASSSTIPGTESPAVKALRSPSTNDVANHGSFASPLPSPSHSNAALAKASTAFAAAPGVPLLRHGSSTSTKSSPTRTRLGLRGRSSTLSSLRNMPTEDGLATPTLPSASTRTSTSTGRKSFGDLFGLSHRLRQNSEPPFHHGSGPATPGSSTSKKNSMQLVREPVVPIVLPERHEDDTPAKYLVRLEEAVSRGVVASVLSKGTDPFSQAVLRSYMRGFGFFGDPMDMAIRKLLMEVELPKETQQIDRCLQGFANRYHECNPGIYASPDQAYFIAFSLLILHTDVFNKNNKHKMQRPDYLKNTRGEGIFDEILECFYDNISYTPFIHVEDDLDINGERIIQHKPKKKSIFPRGAVDPTKRPSKEPVDPYTLIIDSKLDSLRPNLKEVMTLEEPYTYLGTASSLNLQDLQKTFFRTGVLQIVSARSRPDAFMNDKTLNNPEEAQAGIVDIKITKVGLLWRKDAKKKKTRSPWQEWGAILTGAQLYFFRNTTWIKNLMHQLETHIKQGHDGSPVIFKPPLDSFKPDALMSTDDAVALLDSTYKKHKNAFVFVRHGGFEETFLADNEDEMNDWLAKLNYAAAFRTSGVRMRGVVGGNYDGQRTRGIRRLDSHNDSIKSVQTPTGEVTIVSGKIDTKMAQDILAARREIMLQKIADAELKLVSAEKQLDAQLRNARHLQILAPIQPKTREQVILAAGRMAAQLKWGRMEIWRLKCHKDILTMDLEEEKNPTFASPRRERMDNPTSEHDNLSRLPSKASSSTPQRTPRSPASLSTNRPSTANLPKSPISPEREVDDFFQTPPDLAKSSSFHKAQASWELPPISFDAHSARKASVSSVLTPSSPNLATTPSKASLKPVTTSDSQRAPSLNIDAAEQTVLEQEGLVDTNLDKTPDGKRPAIGSEIEEGKDHVTEKDKLDRGKIRRSLQRTLREAHVPNHTRSRKGKDSSSSAGLSEESKDDVLSRGTGSFVVHGKKASVIHFGSELQSMSQEERKRLRKQSHKDEPGQLSPTTIEDDFHSVLAEPYEFHERHDSQATTSTATARSFRDLHRKLASHSLGHAEAVTSDAESDAAISIAEGRQASLPTVEDEDDLNSGRPTTQAYQATFYTPEGSNSPAMQAISEKHLPPIRHDEDDLGLSENERLPALQTVISA